MFSYSLGDYDIGHQRSGVAADEEAMVAAAVAFAEEFCAGEPVVTIDYENRWLVQGLASKKFKYTADHEGTNFLEDGRYIIGSFTGSK